MWARTLDRYYSGILCFLKRYVTKEDPEWSAALIAAMFLGINLVTLLMIVDIFAGTGAYVNPDTGSLRSYVPWLGVFAYGLVLVPLALRYCRSRHHLDYKSSALCSKVTIGGFLAYLAYMVGSLAVLVFTIYLLKL